MKTFSILKQRINFECFFGGKKDLIRNVGIFGY